MKWIHLFLIVFLASGCHSSKKKLQSCVADNKVYPEFCRLAAQDEAQFAHFKRSAIFNLMHEGATPEEGKEYLDAIAEESAAFLEYADSFRKNDRIGSPRTFDYGKVGVFSPTTLSYMHIVAELTKLHGSLKGKRIIEMGGGYGGLCSVLSQIHDFESYTIVDLPQSLMLAKKYLERLGIGNVIFLTPEQLGETPSYDLAISRYGFSESNRPLQQRYIDKVLRKSKAGYLMCAQVPKHFRVRPYPKKELLKKLNKAGLSCSDKVEEPLMAQGNYLIVW